MKFDQPAGINPVDRGRVLGQPHDRVDGPLKVTGAAPYAYEHHADAPNAAYGYLLGSAIACGQIADFDLSAARKAPGVLAIITHENAGVLGKGDFNTVPLLGGPQIDHYHQAIALVVAETFEQARSATALISVTYIAQDGLFDLAAEEANAVIVDAEGEPQEAENRHGRLETAFAEAAVMLDEHYSTPDQSHAMMEPHATTASWDGDHLTVWTSSQMVAWWRSDLARTLRIPEDKVRIRAPFIGGGFGGKLFLRTDALMAALGAKKLGRPVKLTLPRPLIANNTTHRPATRQHIKLGARKDGTLIAIGHISLSGDQPNGAPELATNQTELLYAGENRLTAMRLAILNLPEGNSMRAPGEAPGLMALEIAMDEMAEKLNMDPVSFRIKNDTAVDPQNPERPYSQRHLARCLCEGAERFGWSARETVPGCRREGRWLVGMGLAAAFRNNLNVTSGARVRLETTGKLVVETDMTDIGTGSYTIIAQTAAEMLGLPIDQVEARLGDSRFPVSSGSGGQFGANSSTSGVYAACIKLRAAIAARFGMDENKALFENGKIIVGRHACFLRDAVHESAIEAEDTMEWGDLDKRYQQSTFGAHFVEVGVDRYTGVVRVRRMLAVCDAGRILNPQSARSQVIGAMTMGVGAALMEKLAVDTTRGFFVNHDLASYEVPVHLDIPHQDVVFLNEVDDKVSPMKAKGVGELGLCGVAAAIANAVYNATGVRVRDYPVTPDKLLGGLPAIS